MINNTSNESTNSTDVSNSKHLKNIFGNWLNRVSNLNTEKDKEDDTTSSMFKLSNAASNQLKTSNAASNITTQIQSSPSLTSNLIYTGPTQIGSTYGGSQNFGFDFGNVTYDDYISGETVELKLIDGSRIVDKFSRLRVYDIRQHKKNDSDNDPKNVYTSFKYMIQLRHRNPATDAQYDVDCNIGDLCFLLGIEYKPFSKTILERVVKNG